MSEIYLYNSDIKRLKKEIKQSKKYIKKNNRLPDFILENMYIGIYDDSNIEYKVLLPYIIFNKFSEMSFIEFAKFSSKHFKKISYKELEESKDTIPFKEYKLKLKNNPIVLDFEKSIDLLLFLFKIDKSKFNFERKVWKFIEICELSNVDGVDDTLLDYEKTYFFKNYVYHEGMLN